jgi:hypothetical protein
MKKVWTLFCIIISLEVSAQELFVVTEPASNMPAGAIGIRTMNSFMYEKDGTLNYHIMPEIMWGPTAKWMFHLQSFHSNRIRGGLKTEGGSVYAKFRLLSRDDLHKHFRMALYGRYSLNNTNIHQDEIETMGHNTGYESGIVATKLVNKLALSSSCSFEKALNNLSNNKFPAAQSNNATNYTLSVGKLVYPKKYTNLTQTNINIMCEFLGQTLNNNGKSYLDIVPSLQFIIRSQARIDIAYRKQMYGSMSRTAPSGFLIKFEYTFFNVSK